MMKTLMLALACIFIGTATKAGITLPKIFGDNMVLQRNVKIPIWGTANAGEEVKVKFNRQTKTVKADASGKWTLYLDPEQAGGPYNLHVKGSSSVSFENVMVGEVWLCSGQSNMEWVVAISQNAAAEMAAANFPAIRHIKIEKDINSMPMEDFKSGSWKLCSPSTVGDFTAVGYFFAKQIYAKLKVPVGLINASWGGTNIETWTSREAFESSAEFKEMISGMPVLNLDSLSALRQRSLARRIETIQGAPLARQAAAAFKDAGYDDSKWPEIKVPSLWESQAPGEVDGVVWLRKTIELTAQQAAMPATLHLAMIDDNDEAYINGVKVGSTNSYNSMRVYKIESAVLKAGKNVIAVKVTDTGGGGGIYGDAASVQLVLGTETYSLAGNWRYQVESLLLALDVNAYPSLAFNAMVNPIIPYAIKAVLWYQGETNAPRAVQYKTAFPLMIQDWRKRWNTNLPFYFVQLATYHSNGNANIGSDWAELREAQTATLSLPNTGMAVTTDIGNAQDIHPRNKQDVGKRLAAIALNNLYGMPQEFSGPMYTSMTLNTSNIVLSFDHVGKGLAAKPAGAGLQGFEIAGADKVFYPATAIIKNNQVIVHSEKVPAPVAVRYGWKADDSEINLFNANGFPASPFRTDDWKLSTEGVKYTFEKL